MRVLSDRSVKDRIFVKGSPMSSENVAVIGAGAAGLMAAAAAAEKGNKV
ncbi:MAG: NAD(P)/FAD-dependent oxidoreductase, partial [Acidaminococcaceae bacterium]|nr:NAD(P)/FAD-dependent oxidoreductase [Acidaminococcaceae bacterium]